MAPAKDRNSVGPTAVIDAAATESVPGVCGGALPAPMGTSHGVVTVWSAAVAAMAVVSVAASKRSVPAMPVSPA